MRPPVRYRVTIPEEMEHTELHSRLKEMVAREGGYVVVERAGKPQDPPEGDPPDLTEDSVEFD